MCTSNLKDSFMKMIATHRAKKVVNIILALLFFSNTNSQNCDCKSALSFIYKKLQTNYIGYSEKINTKNKKSLVALQNKLLSQANNTSTLGCYSLMLYYVKKFNDPHVYVSVNNDSIPYKILSEYFRNEDKNITDTGKIWDKIRAIKNNNLSIIGLWRNPAESELVAIIQKSKSEFIGVILESANIAWASGQTRFYLKKSTKEYRMTYVENNRTLSQTTLRLHDSSKVIIIRGVVWFKVADVKETIRFPKQLYPFQNFYSTLFKKINGQYVYIKLHSFEFRNKILIDSIITKNWNQLMLAKYVIIDLRNNRGGYNSCYDTLRSFIISKDVRWPAADVLSSEDNIRHYEELASSENVSSSASEEINRAIIKMKYRLNKRVEIDSAYIIKKGRFHSNDRKIIFLINEFTASSAEYLLLEAKTNPNVVIVGSNSRGAIDYTNVANIDTPCKIFNLGWATMTSSNQKRYDPTGIRPDILMESDNLDWLAYVIDKIK